ncbi:MAG: hypothetical protein CBB60_000025, partial [Armatimonadetes bacterium Cent15-Ar3]
MKGSELYSLVNIFAGTDSHHGFSTGNSLPLIAYPWGHTHWTIQTTESRWFFHPDHQKFQGFRATHQPSPWMGDYGQLVFMPFTGEPPRLDPEGRSSAYSSGLQPDKAIIFLKRYGIHCHLLSRRTGAKLAWGPDITFPTTEPLPILNEKRNRFLVEGFVDFEAEQTVLRVRVSKSSGGTPDNFSTFYLFKFSEQFTVEQVGEDRLYLDFGVIRSEPPGIG